jgi:multiple sugar transport system substrate-binding protein
VDAFNRTPEGRDVTVEWHIQLVGDYESRPLADLTTNYDLLVIDHLYVGEAAESGCLAGIPEMPSAYVGPSSVGCAWRGVWWAYPLDANCHVCAYSPARWRNVPPTWDRAFELAEGGLRMAVPLAGEHALTALCTLLASLGRPIDPETGFPESEALQRAVGLLRRLVETSRRDILCWNPMQALNALAEGAVDFVPLTSGNVGVQSRGVRFGLVPSFDGGPSSRATFSGTGMAVSANCPYPKEAMAFARFISSGRVQTTLWAANGGQPAHREAWDTLAHSDVFYRDIRLAIETSYLRPRFAGWNRFQETAGDTVCEWLSEPNHRFSSLESRLRRLWDDARGKRPI